MPIPARYQLPEPALRGLSPSICSPVQRLLDRPKMRDGQVLGGGRLPGPCRFHESGASAAKERYRDKPGNMTLSESDFRGFINEAMVEKRMKGVVKIGKVTVLI